MTGKIALFFETYQNPRLSAFISDHQIIRLRVLARLITKEGKTDPFDALIDTGAHMTIIPYSIWKDCAVEEMGDYTISGISAQPECEIPVKLGYVKISLHDRYGSGSESFRVPACLAKSDEVPFLIGFMDLLSRFVVHFDFEGREAYLESRGPPS